MLEGTTHPIVLDAHADAAMLVACSQVASSRRDNSLLLSRVDDHEVHEGGLYESCKAAGAQQRAARAAGALLPETVTTLTRGNECTVCVRITKRASLHALIGGDACTAWGWGVAVGGLGSLGAGKVTCSQGGSTPRDGAHHTYSPPCIRRAFSGMYKTV